MKYERKDNRASLSDKGGEWTELAGEIFPSLFGEDRTRAHGGRGEKPTARPRPSKEENRRGKQRMKENQRK